MLRPTLGVPPPSPRVLARRPQARACPLSFPVIPAQAGVAISCGLEMPPPSPRVIARSAATWQSRRWVLFQRYCPMARARSCRQPDGFLVMTQMETLPPSSQTPGPWKSPLPEGWLPDYSQIDDNYSQIDYIWEMGCVAAVVPAPALWSAGAPSPVPPGVRRACHPV
jgi:hypothetical protein